MTDLEYPKEFHTIITADDYILTLTRIPGPIQPDYYCDENSLIKKRIKPAVLFVHGAVCCADHWLINTPDKVLPYRLANEGYDCWLANLRGSPLSKGHAKIPKQSKSRKYWNFCLDEIGRFDIKSMIDYILMTTGNEGLSYIGHSLGCAGLFVTLIVYPEYCSKIKVMAALAPSLYGDHITNKIFRFMLSLGVILGRSKLIRNRKSGGKTFADTVKTLFPFIKAPENLGGFLFKWIARKGGLMGRKQIEKENIQKLALELPRNVSLKLVFHGAQAMTSGVPRQYSYGRRANLKIYGQEIPPEYKLSKCDIPVALFYSNYDEVCPPGDVQHLAGELPNVIGLYPVTEFGFGYCAFLFGKNVNRLVYDQVLQVIRGAGEDCTDL